jgi:hypothetical protein
MNTAASTATLTPPPPTSVDPSTTDSGMPSSTVPSTIASATPPARAAGSMLLRPAPPIRSISVSPAKKVVTPAENPSAGAPFQAAVSNDSCARS